MDGPAGNPKSTWSIQDAKNSLSAVIAAAQKEPQTITKHGKTAAVLLSPDEYETLKLQTGKPAKTFVEHLLAMPQGPDDEEELFERMQVRFRDIEF